MKQITRLMAICGMALLLWACPRNQCPEGVDALLRDYTGLSGCRWVLELEDGERLEPVNLHELDFEPRDNLQVRVQFTEAEDMMSICMVGRMVNIVCISSK
jgi:hypothetical protein